MVLSRTTKIFSIFIFFLVFVLTLFATPVTDDYCLAFASQEFGILNSFNYLNAHWNPSLWYLFPLWLWSLPLSTLTIAALGCVISLLFSFGLARSAILRILKNEYSVKRDELTSIILIGCVGTLALAQSSIYFTSESARSVNPVGILEDWLFANFFNVKDGQLLRWTFSTPLTSLRIFFTILIIYLISYLVKYKSLGNVRRSFLCEIIALTLAFLLGLTSETVTVIIFLCFAFAGNYISKRNTVHAIIFFVTFVVGSIATLNAPGSKIRNDILTYRSAKEYFTLFIGNVWQLSWIALTATLVSFMSIHILRVRSQVKEANFPNSTRVTFRLLFASSLIAQICVETYTYPAAYHWISFALISFLASLIEFDALELSFTRSKIGNRVLLFGNALISLLLVYTLVNTAYSAYQRRSDWEIRSSVSVMQNQKLFKSLDVEDNDNVVYAPDLILDFSSIVAFHGYKPNFTQFCYSRLPNEF